MQQFIWKIEVRTTGCQHDQGRTSQAVPLKPLLTTLVNVFQSQINRWVLTFEKCTLGPIRDQQLKPLSIAAVADRHASGDGLAQTMS